MDAAVVDKEVSLLQHTIAKYGLKDDAGRFYVPFGQLYTDTQDIFEALAGTLKTAKKRGLVEYSAPILLKGPSDKVAITLLKEAEGPPPAGH